MVTLLSIVCSRYKVKTLKQSVCGMDRRFQPTWIKPISLERNRLKLYNSLTRQKEEFVPLDGNNVKWYSCGPTVYDASHMGHARSYISFDILRRVLSDYFGFNVLYVMNITDIDDKIIKRARQNYLFDEYVTTIRDVPIEQLISDHSSVLEQIKNTSKGTTDPDKKLMIDNTLKQLNLSIDRLSTAVSNGNENLIQETRLQFLTECKDPISEWLDKNHGSNVTENSIFKTLPKFWENEFHKDMSALNILPPDVLTRVSDYVPQIIAFIERIITNGFAYVANNSVYFDVIKFDNNDIHHYAKLVPEAYGDTKSLQEGEGALGVTEDRLLEKRSPNDFALWKASKLGEPSWESPWGRGRPGWHIECSAMASDIFGSIFDIHTGGVDLKFPHHDNELAQSEAAFNSSEWVKYFLHTGHLTISGCKMSKSLKNFVTIQDALKNNTPTQLRLAFLLHSWKETLDYSENTMETAVQYERFLNEFFLNVKDLTRHLTNNSSCSQFNEWKKVDSMLFDKFSNFQNDVHIALCDNIDTRTVLNAIREMVSYVNIYIRDNKSNLNTTILWRIAMYITDLLHIFGVITGSRNSIGFPLNNTQSNGTDMEEKLLSYATVVAEFRNVVREEAKVLKAINILKLCDELRDDVLPNLGVRLEDKENDSYGLKIVDRDQLMKDREMKKNAEVERLQEKERNKLMALKETQAKECRKKIDPTTMFLCETDKYSKFDLCGLPTHDKDGKEISKGLLKKLQKLQKQQETRYFEYLASLNKTN